MNNSQVSFSQPRRLSDTLRMESNQYGALAAL